MHYLNAISTAFNSQIREKIQSDELARDVKTALDDNALRHPLVALSECEFDNSILLYRNLKYIPDNEALRAEVIQSYYDSPTAGHPGRASTFEYVTRNF